MDVGRCSQAGKRYGDLNQDYAILQEMFSAEEMEGNPHASQCLIAGVADGHGMLGEEAAKGGGKAIVRYLMRSELQRKALSDMSEDGIRDLLVEAFEKGHRSALNAIDNPPQKLRYPGNNCRKTQEWTLVQADGVDVYQGAKGQERLLENGAACSVALIQGNKLVIADVGDSLVVLGRENASGEASAELVSQRHSIRDPQEVERLLKHHSDSIEVLEDDGYVRVTQGQLFGYELAMTRALGHRHMGQHGVSHEPHVASITLEPEHCCLMLGSDGVWDHLDRDAAVQFCVREVNRDRTAQQIATDIVAQALAIADKQGEDDAADNATLVLVIFPQHSAEKSRAHEMTPHSNSNRCREGK